MYTNQQAIEDYRGKTLTVSGSALEEWIEAMTNQVDYITQRTIYRENIEASTYKYDGDSTNKLLIDACHDITSVKADETVVEVYEYPANKDYVTKVETKSGVFPRGKQNIEVLAKQSMFSELPADVKFATTVLVTGIYNARYSEVGKGKASERIGNYQVTFINDQQKSDYEDAKRILQRYKKITV